MIILWIDPGLATVGFALIEKEQKKTRIIEYGVIETKNSCSTSERIFQIVRDLEQIIDVYKPTICGMERLFFLRNVTNGIDVAQARWAISLTLFERGIPLIEFTPLQVKQWITWNGFAKKPQVQKALSLIFSLRDIPKPDDAADALWVAYLTSMKTGVNLRL